MECPVCSKSLVWIQCDQSAYHCDGHVSELQSDGTYEPCDLCGGYKQILWCNSCKEPFFPDEVGETTMQCSCGKDLIPMYFEGFGTVYTCLHFKYKGNDSIDTIDMDLLVYEVNDLDLNEEENTERRGRLADHIKSIIEDRGILDFISSYYEENGGQLVEEL